MSGEDDTREYSTVDLRKNLGQALGRAHFQGEEVKISHHGKLYAKLVSPNTRMVSNEDADLLEKIEPVKRLIIDKLDDGLNINEIVVGMREHGTSVPALSDEEVQFKKLMVSNGFSFLDMVSVLEGMVSKSEVGKAARPVTRPKAVAPR